jgi:hypothetical protein
MPQQKIVLPNLPVVGLKKPEKKKLNEVEEAVSKLNQDVGTEKMIKNILRFLEKQQKKEAKWPIDAMFNKKIKESLSYSKMINEINHRKPR